MNWSRWAAGSLAILWLVYIVVQLHSRRQTVPQATYDTELETGDTSYSVWKDFSEDRPLNRWREAEGEDAGDGSFDSGEEEQGEETYEYEDSTTALAESRYEEVIAEIMSYNGTGQQEREDYLVTVNTIARMRPCNVLIFGVGTDSNWYIRANTGGRTVFIENNPKWVSLANTFPYMNESEVYQYNYTTDMVRTSEWLLQQPSESELKEALFMGDLPESVLNAAWDFVLVDAPLGLNGAGKPGRFQPISMLEHFMRKPRAIRRTKDELGVFHTHKAVMHVFVHDCQRKGERLALRAFGWLPAVKHGVTLVRESDKKSKLCYFQAIAPLVED